MTGMAQPVSPRAKARAAGGLYLVIIVAALFAEIFVRGKLTVSGDAAATAHNILSHPLLYRLGGAADLIAFACDIAVAALFYELFKPVSRALALTAAAFRLAYAAVVVANIANHFAPLIILDGGPGLAAFSTGQLQALALTFLRLHGAGYNIALILFGTHCVLIGWLVLRSRFLPRVLGPMLVLAGLCYLANSFGNLLAPAFASRLFPYILLPGALAEWSLCVWLIVVGLNQSKWRAQAASLDDIQERP